MRRNLLFLSSYTGLGGGERIQLNLMEALDRDRFALHLVVPADGQFTRAARDLGVTTHILPFRGASTWFVPAIWKRFPVARRLTDLVSAAGYSHHPQQLPRAAVCGIRRARRAIPVLWYSIGWWFPVRPWQRRFFRQEVTQIAAASLFGARSLAGAFARAPAGARPGDLAWRQSRLFPPRHRRIARPRAVGHRAGGAAGGDAGALPAGEGARYVSDDGAADCTRRCRKPVSPSAGENVFGVRKDETYKRAILDHAREDPVLSRCLTYLGHYDDPRPVIAAADVVVCPSRFESLGMVHLESMAMARPVVSMNNGGPAETIIDGRNRLSVPPEDPDALAARVLTLLRDPGAAGAHGTGGPRTRYGTFYRRLSGANGLRHR